MAWLESWAKAAVQASEADQLERDAQREVSIYVGDGDFTRGDGKFEGGGRHENFQARRRAMKAAVRNRYAVSTMATLWADEITT